MPNAKYQRCRVFVRNDLVERKNKSCRKSSKKTLEFKKKFGLDPDVVTCDKQDIMSTLQVAIEGEIIHTQFCFENKRLEVYVPKYKLGIEVDEYNHEGRNFEYKQSRHFIIKRHGITNIRTNPANADFDMNTLITKYTRKLLNQLKNRLKYQLNNH